MTQTHTIKETPLRILGIKVSKRALGYAVLKGNDLQLFGVRGVYGDSPHRQSKEASEFVRRLIDGFSPGILAIDSSSKASDDPARGIREQLVRLARKRGLRIRPYTLDAMRKIIMTDTDITKGEVAATVVEWFPYLERYLRTDLRTTKVYWRKMLEAVAFAWIAHEEHQRKRVLRALNLRPKGPSPA